MRAFITTAFILLLLEILVRIGYMAIKDWPHTYERKIGLYSADICGQFIPMQDFMDNKAIRQIVSVDSEHTAENYETLCKKHAGQKSNSFSGMP